MDVDPTDLTIASHWRPHVLDAWLCGSSARGDADRFSDIDVTLVIDDDAELSLVGKAVHHAKAGVCVDCSVYTLGGFTRLTSPPSLFAWHLRAEGICLLPPGPAAALLTDLAPFRDHVEDLAVLEQAARECLTSLGRSTESAVFDLGVLATVVRNTALVVSHFDGAPDFSRRAPIALREHPVVPLPFETSTYDLLCRARLAGAGRGVSAKTLTLDAPDVARRVVLWVEKCRWYTLNNRAES